MPPISPISWSFAACALLALPAQAQVKPPSAAPAESIAASASTGQGSPATLPYTSAFEGYQPFHDEKLNPWKESNATVEKVGGWRAYAKEAAEPQVKHDITPTSSPAAAPKAPAAPAAPHTGHGKH